MTLYRDMLSIEQFKANFDASTFSSVVNLKDYALSGIRIPDGMAGTSLGIQMSYDQGTTFIDVYDDYGVKIAIPIGATMRFLSLKRLLPLGLNMLRFVSSATESCDIHAYSQQVA